MYNKHLSPHLASYEMCSGCKACGAVCPQSAITFKSNELGFEYPYINSNICVKCGKCESICPIYKFTQKHTPIKVYAAIAKDADLVYNSASGGIFAALALNCIQNGGVVYGAAMLSDKDNILSVRHIRVDNVADIKKLQRSKYVQSDLNGVYHLIREDLLKRRKVIFSGTPCQTAAIRKVFPNENNLLIIDIICHGVPSQLFFTNYLCTLTSGRKKQKVIDFNFRSKKSGWGLCAEATLETNAGKEKKIQIPCQLSSYYHMFLHGEIYRDCCYQCPYATKERIGDITLGDYWGIQKQKVEYEIFMQKGIDITKGISCILVNSEKGIAWLKESDVEFVESNFESVAKENHQLYEPSRLPDTREKIISEYLSGGYSALENLFQKGLGIKKYFIMFKSCVPASIRMCLRMLFDK